MKRFLVFIIILLSLFVSVTQVVRADLILNPSDDTYIDVFNPTVNYDGQALIVDYSNSPCANTRSTYLKFNLSSLPSDVGETTKIRVYINIAPITSGTLALWSTGDDWNGASDGLGGETTLTNQNAPAVINQLDTKPSGTTNTWVEFTGSNLSNYINNERVSDGVASFVVNWSNCVDPVSDAAIFEDRENSMGSGNPPELYPFSPTAITLSAFSASGHANNPWVFVLGVGLLVAMIAIGIVLRRRTKIAV